MFCHHWDRTQNHQSLEHIEEGRVWMPVTGSSWRAWNTRNEDADLRGTDFYGQGKDVIMLSLQGFAQGRGERGNLEFRTSQRLQQVMDDELGRGKIFDENEERAMAMFRNNFTGIGKKRRWNHCWADLRGKADPRAIAWNKLILKRRVITLSLDLVVLFV